MKKGRITINNRLKLYDTTIKLCIDNDTKELLRKIAFSKKITISDYLRQLIAFSIACNNLNNLDTNKNKYNKLIKNFMNLLEEKE